MAMARRKLAIDMVISGPILKTSEKAIWSRFTFTPKMGVAVPKTGNIFISELTGYHLIFYLFFPLWHFLILFFKEGFF